MSQEQEILNQIIVLEDDIREADEELGRSRKKQQKRVLLTKGYRISLDKLVSRQSELKTLLKQSVSSTSPKYLKSCIEYNPNTGSLIWQTRPAWHFPSAHSCDKWNASNAGNSVLDEAGEWGTKSVGDHSLYIILDGPSHKVSELCWRMVYNKTPQRLTHINKNRTDFRIENLKELAPLT